MKYIGHSADVRNPLLVPLIRRLLSICSCDCHMVKSVNRMFARELETSPAWSLLWYHILSKSSIGINNYILYCSRCLTHPCHNFYDGLTKSQQILSMEDELYPKVWCVCYSFPLPIFNLSFYSMLAKDLVLWQRRLSWCYGDKLRVDFGFMVVILYHDLNLQSSLSPLTCWIHFRKRKRLFAFFIICQHYDGKGSWNSPSVKTKPLIVYSKYYNDWWPREIRNQTIRSHDINQVLSQNCGSNESSVKKVPCIHDTVKWTIHSIKKHSVLLWLTLRRDWRCWASSPGAQL